MKTEREFLNRVYELVTDEEVLAYIDGRLEKLDAVNERRRAKNAEKDKVRIDLCKKIVEWHNETNTVLTASAVAEFLTGLGDELVSTAKASPLLRFGVQNGIFADDGEITVTKVNAQGKTSKSKIKAYKVADAEADEFVGEVVDED